MFRCRPAGPEVFLVHLGGPFWAKKDTGAWSIPKGLVDPNEEPLEAARREFTEETGTMLSGPFLPLGSFRQSSAKMVVAWAVEGDLDPEALISNTFEMEWPPRSGETRSFPEVDRGGWFDSATAEEKMIKGQRPILAALHAALANRNG